MSNHIVCLHLRHSYVTKFCCPPCWRSKTTWCNIICYYTSIHFSFFRIMPLFCLVFNCPNKKSKRKDLTFCRVPKIIKNQGEETEILSAERWRRWLTAISRADLTDKILEYDRVCGEHFYSGKAAPLWDKWNVDWVPSLKLGHEKLKVSEASVQQS